MTDNTEPVEVELTSGEVVIIHPGDTAILTFDRPMSAQEADKVRKYWTEQAPGTRVIILAAPAALAGVVRADVIANAMADLITTEPTEGDPR